MLILSRLFGRSRQPVMRDIIAGYKFCATMQLRTPLRVLRRHGEFQKGVDRVPDQIANEMWEGIWIPVAHTFRELGIDLDEPPHGSMASDIGPIPQDGGEYLKFLIAVRTAAEAPGGSEERRLAVAAILGDAAWNEIVRSLEGPEAILSRLFPAFLSTVPGMPTKTASALIGAGYGTPNAVRAATDALLRSIPGIGPTLLKALRDAAINALEPNSRYVDRVVR